MPLDPASGPVIPRVAQQHLQVPYQYSSHSQTVPSRPPSVVPPLAQPYASARQTYVQDSALFQLLGVDLEAYLNSHVSEYEDAKNRWITCSLKEWEEEGSIGMFFRPQMIQ